EHRLGQSEHGAVYDVRVGEYAEASRRNVGIVERRDADVDGGIVDAGRLQHRDGVELAAVLQLDEILVRQIVRDVGVAAFQQRAAVAGLRHHAPDHALDLWQGTTGPRVVTLHDDFGAGGPLRYLVGAGARGLLLGVFETPGILLGGVLLHQLRVDDARHDDREVRDGQAVLLGAIDPHSVVVDDDELL